MNRILAACLCLPALLAMLGCGNPPAHSVDKTRVVTTVAMVADLARQIGGDRVEVTSLFGAGIDPHTYKPTADDLRLLREAQLVLYVGHHLEGRMGDVLGKLGQSGSGRKVIAVSEEIDQSQLLQDEQNAFDPHIWMDVSLWAQTIDVVTAALAEVDPAGRIHFEARADDYRKQLADLHAYGQKVMAGIPADRRVLVTAHDAFGYLGRAYGIEVLGIQGISTESEAGLRRVSELVDLLVTRRVPAVFVETSVSHKGVQSLIEGAAAAGHAVTIGGELFSDAMGTDGTYQGTYVGMLDHNLTVIARALGGNAPPRGFADKLAAAN